MSHYEQIRWENLMPGDDVYELEGSKEGGLCWSKVYVVSDVNSRAVITETGEIMVLFDDLLYRKVSY